MVGNTGYLGYPVTLAFVGPLVTLPVWLWLFGGS